MTSSVRRVLRGARDARAVTRQPPYVEPGHFYSPLSTPADAARAISWLDRPPVGVDLRIDEQLALVAELAPYWVLPPSTRYEVDNNQYGAADAAVLRSVLMHHQPKRVLEVGSGYSSVVMLESGVDMELTCVEPYPERLLSRLQRGDRDRLELLQIGAQDIPLSRFAELQAGDILFIDSTHVVKPGSDVVWLFLHVLPTLAPGVLIHIHDVFWPFEYPQRWLEQRRDWTELYLLRALLTGSSMFQIELFSAWLWREHRDLIPVELREPGASNIWLRKIS